MSKVITLIEKKDIAATVKTLRSAVITHNRQIKQNGATQGVFISRNDRGDILCDSYNITAEEKISLLDTAKYLTHRGMWE